MTVKDTPTTTSRGHARPVPTTPSEPAVGRADAKRSSAASDGRGRPADAPRGGWRERVRSKPGLSQAYRVGVFATGLLLIVLGFALAVLPGPLTIPPVLIGLWIWSTEFRFARKLFDSFERKARDAWQHAKVHPVSSTAVTVGGLAGAGAAAWAISHFELVAKGQDAIGL